MVTRKKLRNLIDSGYKKKLRKRIDSGYRKTNCGTESTVVVEKGREKRGDKYPDGA